ncbi:hypothetical protein MACH09_34710 [Vibrio sp. MACH09]|uniref:hypothetical protein n=1 Tax=Vibrio sp. MACH09 TaxID=3025122 RepID=UPI002794F10D|nr:hypothetical protein [Vibrio sp. MACH09]GLO62963.1 hypothetical protein MACH09_34710 [Vibrio sp. MACH09]
MNIRPIILIIVIAIFSFWLGLLANEFYYDDICLDLGGGKNPGDYPICIIEK